MNNCGHICPHCGKCTKEDVPPTEEGRINALLNKIDLKLVRIIDRETAACLLHETQKAKVYAYDKIDYLLGNVKLSMRKYWDDSKVFELEIRLFLTLQKEIEEGFKEFEVGIHMGKMDRDHIIFVLAESK